MAIYRGSWEYRSWNQADWPCAKNNPYNYLISFVLRERSKELT
jgi:hypothetical protein